MRLEFATVRSAVSLDAEKAEAAIAGLAAARADVLVALAEKIGQIEGRRPPTALERVSSGSAALDAILPARGLRRGTLVEWLAARAGGGAITWAVAAAAQACRQGGAVVVVDRSQSFHAPAAAAWGVRLEAMIVVRPGSRAEETWACDQILRSPGVAALLAWPERLDDRTFRRLQLAAQEGGVLGLLARRAEVRATPSWADLRLLVEPLATAPGNDLASPGKAFTSPGKAAGGRRFRIEILHARGGGAGRAVEATLPDG